MKKLTTFVAAVILVASMAVSPAAADTADNQIQELSKSATPLEDLDEMDQASKDKVKMWVQNASEQEVMEVFYRPVYDSTRTANTSRRAYSDNTSRRAYSDILFGFFEKVACVTWVDLISCNRASRDAAAASSAAEKKFSRVSLHNGKGDAFRHCYWNARMVHSIGYRGAVKISINHEAIRGGPKDESRMDMANNETGWAVGKSTSNNAQAERVCYSKASRGKLVTLK